MGSKGSRPEALDCLMDGTIPTPSALSARRAAAGGSPAAQDASPTQTGRRRGISLRVRTAGGQEKIVEPSAPAPEVASRTRESTKQSAVAKDEIPYELPPESFAQALLELKASPMKTATRLRGESFRSEYLAAMARGDGTTRTGSPPRTLPAGRQRAPTMLHDTRVNRLVPPKLPKDTNKLTVVLDLDETLMYAREGPLYARPYLQEFITFIGSYCEVIVWTAGVRPYAKAVVKEIDPHGVISHCIYRHTKWFSGDDYTKELKALGRPLDTTLIIENTPSCVERNIYNGIVVQDYEGTHGTDVTLLCVASLIMDLVQSRMPVPKFIAHSKSLLLLQYEGTLFYFLPTDLDAVKDVKVNLDKSGQSGQGALQDKPFALQLSKDMDDDDDDDDDEFGSFQPSVPPRQ